MKLAIVTGDPRQWTGGINYVLNMSRVLRRFNPNIEIQLMVQGTVPSNLTARIESSTGAAPEILPPRSMAADALRMTGRPCRSLCAALDRHGIDILFEASGYLGDLNVPAVSWIPDFQHRHLPQLFSKTAWLAREARFRRILTKRRFLLLSSEDARHDMECFYPQYRGSLHVVPFAVDLEHWPKIDEIAALRAKLGLPERFFFLPNQFWPHKNHSLIVQALRLLKRGNATIASTGIPVDHRSPDRTSKLQQLVVSHGLQTEFRLLGELPYADILALNAGSTALINPSMFEGWSTTVEEAKALGTPLLLSDLDVHKEQAGDFGLYFKRDDPADCAAKISQMIERPPPRMDDQARTRNRQDLHEYAQRLTGLLHTASK